MSTVRDRINAYNKKKLSNEDDEKKATSFSSTSSVRDRINNYNEVRNASRYSDTENTDGFVRNYFLEAQAKGKLKETLDFTDNLLGKPTYDKVDLVGKGILKPVKSVPEVEQPAEPEKKPIDTGYNPNANMGTGLSSNTNKLLYEYINGKNTEGTVKYAINRQTDFNPDSLSKMTADQISSFNSIWDNEGADKAKDYLKSIARDLDKQRNTEVESAVAEVAEDHPVLSSVASIPFKVVGGWGAFGSDVNSVLHGENINPYSSAHTAMNIGSKVQQAVSEDIADNTNAHVGSMNVGSFLYNTGMSTVESAAQMLTGNLTTTLMGGAAFSQRARELIEQGASEDQVILGAAAAGIAEGLFEKISLDRLIKTKNISNWKDVAKNVLKQSFTEGSEEFFTDISNALTDGIIRGAESDYGQKIDYYMSQGDSEGTAKARAAWDVLTQAAESFVGGALSGAVFGSIDSSVRAYNNETTGKAAREKGTSIEALTQLASESKNKDTQKAAAEMGAKPTDMQIGRLIEDISEQANTALSEGINKQDGTKVAEALDTMQRMNNTSADLSEYTKGMSEKESALFESVARNSSGSLESIKNSYDLVKEYGILGGTNADDVLSHKGVLTDRQALQVYEYGLQEHSNAVDTKQTATENYWLEHYNDGDIRGKFSTEGATNISAEYAPVKINTLTARQKSSVAAAEKFSKESGINITFFQSKANEKGKYTAQSGFYDPASNTVYLDVNAGSVSAESKDAIISALSHEITHSFRISSPAVYDEMYKTLLKAEAERLNVSQLAVIKGFKEQLLSNPLSSYTEDSLTDDILTDEFVAYHSEDMFSNSELVQSMLSKMDEKEAQTFAEKVGQIIASIRQFIADLINNVKSYASQEEGVHYETKTLRQMDETYKQMQELWDSALIQRIHMNQALNATGQSQGEALSNTAINAEQSERFSDRIILSKEEYALADKAIISAIKFKKLNSKDIGYAFTAGELYVFDVLDADELDYKIIDAIGINDKNENKIRSIIGGNYGTNGNHKGFNRVTAKYSSKGRSSKVNSNFNGDAGNDGRINQMDNSVSLRAADRKSSGDNQNDSISDSSDEVRREQLIIIKKIANEWFENKLKHSKRYRGNKEKFYEDYRKAMRFSDRTYLDAVNDNDIETAQKMVDEAAKKAGYTERVYHGTAAENAFNVFHSGTGQYGDGVYVTYSDQIAKSYGNKVMKLFVKMQKMATYDDAYEAVGVNDYASHDEFAQSLGYADFDEMIDDWDNDPTSPASNPELIDKLIAKGFDAFEDDGNGGFVLWGIKGFEAKIKLADAVTYDDNGNVIPLSKRFDSTNPDMRYSDRVGATRANGVLEKKAAQYFGLTDDFNVAGYILNDGKMLDFSGVHWLDKDSYSPKEIAQWKKQNNFRQVDHEDIFEIFPDGTTGDTRKQFMDRGNIRISPEAPGINISTKVEPTAAQYKTIRDFVYSVADRGNFYIDLEDKRPDKITYSGNISAERVINDIKTFFATGEKPHQSEVAMFHTMYSDRVDANGVTANTYQNDDLMVRYSVRTDPAPKQTKKAYKLMRFVDGNFYPLFIGNNEKVEVGVWYDAESPNLSSLSSLEPGTWMIDMKTGEATSWADYAAEHNISREKPNVSDVHWANDNGYRFMYIEDKAGSSAAARMKQQYGDSRGYYNWGVNGSSKSKTGEGTASLYALRPGWHFGQVPSMRQIAYQSESGEKDMRLDNQVWVEVEMAADVDYNAEAAANAYGDIPTHIPVNGYYTFATNPTQKKSKSSSNDDKADWYVSGAFKIVRALDDAEADRIVEEFNKKNGKNVPLDYRRAGGRQFHADTMSVYSDRVDTEGNNLTPEQQEFFADSKIRDAEGRLLVMYHGTRNAGFTVFDINKAKSSGLYGKGFYFTSSNSHSATYGDAYKVYLNIKHPLESGTNTITDAQLKKFVTTVAENEDYGLDNYGQSATVSSVVKDLSGRDDFAKLQDINASCIGNFVEAVKLFNEVNGTDYDGIVVPTETVAFYPNQIKLTTNANPTADNDIRFSDRVEESLYETLGQTEQREARTNALLDDMDLLIERMSIEKALTKERVLDEKNMHKAAVNLRNRVQSDMDIATLSERLAEVYGSLFEKKIDKAKLMNDMRELAKQLAEDPKHEKISSEAQNAIDYLHKTTIKVTAEQKKEAAERYGSAAGLRNAYINRLHFSESEGQSIDSFYEEFGKQFPYLVQDVADKDMINALIDVYNGLQSTPVIMSEWQSAEGIEHAVEEIYNQFWRLDPITKTAVANAKKVEDLRLAHQRTMNKLREQNALKFQTAYDAVMKANQEAIQAVKDKAKQSFEKYRMKQSKEAEIKKILAKAKRLNEKVVQNSAKDHVPAEWRKPLAELLQSLDFSSNQMLGTGVPTRKDINIGLAFRHLSDVIAQSSTQYGENPTAQFLDLPQGMAEEFAELTTRIEEAFNQYQNGSLVLRNMSYEDLHNLNNTLTVISSSINKLNKFHMNAQFVHVSDAAHATIKDLESFKDAKSKSKIGQWASDMLEWNNMLPYYAAKRWGTGGQAMFKEVQDGWDKFAFLRKQIEDYADATYTAAEVFEWEKNTHTFNIKGVEFKLSDAQLMSIYCLSKRDNEVGLNHMTMGGLHIADIGEGKDTIIQPTTVHVSKEDIAGMVSELTPRQIEVADKLQKFMSSTCSEWGNETSYQRYGIYAFTEQNYFPIQSDPNNLHRQDAPQDKTNSVFRLLNMSFTKQLTPKANNAIMAYSIFDVFADHATDMAKYNAMALPILDLYKWYSYVEKTNINEQEHTFDVIGTKKELDRVYGKQAAAYIWNWMNDLNGTDNGARGEGSIKGFMSRYKIAAVGANLRVALLQPTSYFRAMAALDTKYLMAGLTRKSGYLKAEKNSGIALWKHQGGFDINIARDVKENIKHTKDQKTLKGAKERLLDKSMLAAEWGDRLTWGHLWNACEEWGKDNVKAEYGTEAFYKAVADKFRDVVYSTQVVDSTMTRTELMRDRSGMIQGLMAFMSEPSLTANMLMDTAIDIKMEADKTNFNTAMKRYAGKARNVMVAYTVTSVVQAIVESAADAWRDDDDDTLPEKWLEHFWDNLFSDLDPLEKIPFAKDLVNTIEQLVKYGRVYGNDDMTTQFVVNWAQSVYDLYKIVEGKKEISYRFVKEVFDAFSQTVGIPLGNALREVKSFYNNTFGTWFDNKWK